MAKTIVDSYASCLVPVACQRLLHVAKVLYFFEDESVLVGVDFYFVAVGKFSRY